MSRTRRYLMVTAAAVLVLAAASILTWHTSAAPAPQELLPGAEANPDRLQALPAPDAPVPGGPHFLMVSAYQFRPRSSGTTWAYDGLDLFNPGAGDSYFDALFNLPNDVTVTKMVVYYYDNTWRDLTAWLVRGNMATGTYDIMASTGSSGSANQYRSSSTTSISYGNVDQQSYSYNITVNIPPGGMDLRLIAVRIDYSTHTLGLPLIQKNY